MAFEFTYPSLFKSLIELITPKGVQASNDALFKDAIFGRDSIRIGLDLDPWLEALSEQIIISLVHFQSEGVNDVTDSRGKGQICHEARFLYNGPRKVDRAQRLILDNLSERWGGSRLRVEQYGSADATPLFVKLVCTHCDRYGRSILDREIRTLSGRVTSVREGVVDAVNWTLTQVERNELGLLGFRRSNLKFGHRFQVMQDGATSLIHEDGTLANSNESIETIGLQGLAYDCLIDAAETLGSEGVQNPAVLESAASDIQRSTIERFWLPEESYFATALDRDPESKQIRQVRTLTSMPTELLETRIFDTLLDRERQLYIEGIVKKAYKPNLMTDAGIRCRSIDYADLLPYSDYQGSSTCWGVVNGIFATGLQSQGLHTLAQDISIRQVDALRVADELFEFLYVRPDGTPWYRYSDAPSGARTNETIVGTNRPERNHGWTISFVLKSLFQRDLSSQPNSEATEWARRLTKTIAEAQPLRLEHISELEVTEKRRAINSAGFLDLDEGRRRESVWLGKSS